MTKAQKEETIGYSCLPIKIKKQKNAATLLAAFLFEDIIFYKTPEVY